MSKKNLADQIDLLTNQPQLQFFLEGVGGRVLLGKYFCSGYKSIRRATENTRYTVYLSVLSKIGSLHRTPLSHRLRN